MPRIVAPFADRAEYQPTYVRRMSLWLAFGAKFEFRNSAAAPPVRPHVASRRALARSHSEAAARNHPAQVAGQTGEPAQTIAIDLRQMERRR